MIQQPTSRSGYWLWLLGALLCAQVPAEVKAAEIGAGSFRVRDSHTRLVEGVYRVSAQVDYELGPQALNALSHGVPLVLELHLEVLKQGDWVWDNVVAELRQRHQLSYHALSERYIATNFHTGVQRSYYKLADALQAIGALYELPVIDARLLAGGHDYQVRMRADLDIEALPTPIRLWAYVSPDWDIESEWYTWPLEP